MPEIAQYTSEMAQRGLNTNPVREGVYSLERSANRVEENYHEAGRSIAEIGRPGQQLYNEYEKHKTFDEVSKNSANWADLQGQQTEEWNGMLKDGSANDPDKIKAFQEKYSDAYTKFGDSFSTDAGKEYALHRVEAAQDHWINKMAADKSVLDATNSVTNFNTTLAANSRRAYNDPSSAGAAIADTEAMIDGVVQHSNMTAEQSARFREHAEGELKNVAKAGAMSMAEGNPQAWIDRKGIDPELMRHLSGEDLNALDNRARIAQRLNTEQQKADVTQQRQMEMDAAKQASTKMMTDMIQPDGSVIAGKDYFTNLKKFGDLPGAQRDPGLVKSMYELGRQVNEDAAKEIKPVTDQTVYTKLAGGLYGGTTTLQQINMARVNHQLSDHDWTSLKDAMQVPKDPFETKMLDGAISAASSQLHGVTSSPGDPAYIVGDAAKGRFLADFYPAVMKGKAEGKTMQDILYGKDGIATPDRIKQYLPNGDDLMKSLHSNEDVQKAIQELPNPGVVQKPGQTPTPATPSATPANRPPLSSFFGGGGKLAPAPVPPPQGGTLPKQKTMPEA